MRLIIYAEAAEWVAISRHGGVDERLRVHDLRGLRVVDASIMPQIVSPNTKVTTMMIGEKGAAMIKEDTRQHSLADWA